MVLRLTPDGAYYLRLGAGQPVPKPYSRRWLIPRLLGANPHSWACLTWVSLGLTPLAAWFYFGSMGLTGLQRGFATALLCVLPGVWRCSWRFPVLLDAVSFLLTLVIAGVSAKGIVKEGGWLALPLILMAGGVRESIPVFAALWAWSWWPLMGLLTVGWFRKADPADQPWLQHPVREALKLRRALGWDGSLYLKPLGASLAGLVHPSWQLAATLVAGVAQLAVAQDTIRLVGWVAPVLVAAAAQATPPMWMLGALLLSCFLRDAHGRV